MFYIRDTEAWQPSIYLGWLLRQNPHVKYAMLDKTQLFRIFDNVSSKCLGLVVKEGALISFNEKVPSGRNATWNLTYYFLFSLKNFSKKSICF